MKIALIGYGRMGKEIEAIALQKGHSIHCKISSENAGQINELLKGADVAIEFSIPSTVVANIKSCINLGIPVVVGTTAWQEKEDEVLTYVLKNNGCILPASNFSIGVNLFFQMNKLLAKWMDKHEDYQVHVHEVHHTKKLDAPSGTAVSIANDILTNLSKKNRWIHGETNETDKFSVSHERIENVPGTHIVTYGSDIDEIEIKHTAHNRKGFASGALLAAEFIQDKKGIYSMQDVLNLEY